MAAILHADDQKRQPRCIYCGEADTFVHASVNGGACDTCHRDLILGGRDILSRKYSPFTFVQLVDEVKRLEAIVPRDYDVMNTTMYVHDVLLERVTKKMTDDEKKTHTTVFHQWMVTIKNECERYKLEMAWGLALPPLPTDEEEKKQCLLSFACWQKFMEDDMKKQEEQSATSTDARTLRHVIDLFKRYWRMKHPDDPHSNDDEPQNNNDLDNIVALEHVYPMIQNELIQLTYKMLRLKLCSRVEEESIPSITGVDTVARASPFTRYLELRRIEHLFNNAYTVIRCINELRSLSSDTRVRNNSMAATSSDALSSTVVVVEPSPTRPPKLCTVCNKEHMSKKDPHCKCTYCKHRWICSSCYERTIVPQLKQPVSSSSSSPAWERKFDQLNPKVALPTDNIHSVTFMLSLFLPSEVDDLLSSCPKCRHRQFKRMNKQLERSWKSMDAHAAASSTLSSSSSKNINIV